MTLAPEFVILAPEFVTLAPQFVILAPELVTNVRVTENGKRRR